MKDQSYVYNKADNIIDLSRDGKVQDVSFFNFEKRVLLNIIYRKLFMEACSDLLSFS